MGTMIQAVGTMIQAVLLDFHDTLVRCDAWFRFETQTLLADLWRAFASDGLSARPTSEQYERARVLYRSTRLAVHQSGVEVTAQAAAESLLPELGIRLPAEVIAGHLEQIQRQCLAGIAALPGAVATVERLSAAGYRLGVVSNAAYPPFLDWALTRLGLAPYLPVVVTSAGSGIYKSRPGIFWQALEGLGSEPAAAVMMGDSQRFDVAGAQRAGLRAVWLDDGRSPPDPAVRPDAVVRTWPELPVAIARWNGTSG